jgi:L,D-transpeptidase YcbB
MSHKRQSCFALMGFSLSVSLCFGLDEANFIPPENTDVSIAEHNFTELRQALPLYEAAVLHPWSTIPEDALLKPGHKDILVLGLRGRLKATGDLKPENDHGLTFYDTALREAVMHFQARHGLHPDGIVGKETIYEMNIPPEVRLNQIKRSMERWAKLSSQLGDRYILVNVPAYRLDLVENGQSVLSMETIVGKPERPTPEISSTITRLVFNPYWNVPKIIANEDIIPKMLHNPHYLDDMHIRILDLPHNDAYEISPDEIDWQAAYNDGFQYYFRQDPGNNNALGLVKFEFRNSDDIYMHDTPAKNLFQLTKRAYSSGCIRLEKPFELVSYLMRDNPEWTDEKIQEYLDAGITKYVKVAKPTRVFITYITTWVDDNGNLEFRDDIYGWDSDESLNTLNK